MLCSPAVGREASFKASKAWGLTSPRGVLPALKARIRPAPIWLAKASAMRLRAELAVHTNNRL